MLKRRIDSAALLVRSVPYGEADLVATFFTRELGKVAAVVRGARRSARRFGGALEPIHELVVSIEDTGKELCVLKEARIGRPRIAITASLEAMDAAGQALRWVRHVCPPRTPEPAAWTSLERLLGALEGLPPTAREAAHAANASLAVFGLRLLTDIGYALELDRCIRCGRACPEGRPAFVDAAAGGVVCTACGGARRTLSGPLRTLAAQAQRGEHAALSVPDAATLVAVVEDAMAAHAGLDPA
jgi:DNA repair protein RecO (recombination protein O)